MRKSVSHYTWSDKLTAPEIAALKHIGDIADKPILDIGVGAGRTVTGLLDISRNYTGLDYVEEMVDKCQKTFPGIHFEQGDARNLFNFQSGSFHMILFSMNGISMVDHQGRMDILNEIYRLLSPGGAFLFSTYNKDNREYKKLLQLPKLQPSINPIRLGVRFVRYVHQVSSMAFNRYKFKKLEFHADEYSIINDKCHNYATMLYYITQNDQRNQLTSIGFDNDILTFDLSGNKAQEGTLDDSIFYVAKKPR